LGEKQYPRGVGDLNLDRGLSSDDAQRRLKEYGYNEVPEKKVNPLLKLAKKFWGVTPWMLELTVGMELALGKVIEACVIFGLLSFNAAVSYTRRRRRTARSPS